MNRIIRKLLVPTTAVCLALGCLSAAASDKKDPDVGGAAMFPNKTIVQNAVNSPIHKTLVAAVKAAGLVDTLNSPGPFTVFAPTDDAFAKLPAGTVDNLVQPQNKATLTKVLTYHVVPGTYSTARLMKEIKAGGGTLKLKTVEGDDLSFMMDNGHIKISDDKGGSAMITTANVYQSNGVIQVIDTVLMP
jgi:uncharacterized surface protein with fasciclin (FAS1) repeats